MERQEALNLAVKGLASQGFTVARSSGGCAYYDYHTGNRCAVGWLVSEGAAMELPMGSVDEVHHLLPREVQDLGASFLTDLQDAHDSVLGCPVGKEEEWMRRALIEFAEGEGLEIPEVLK